MAGKKKLKAKDIQHISVRELAYKIKAVDDYIGSLKGLEAATHRKPTLAFFIGAGASVESGVILAGQMMEEFKKKIFEINCYELKTNDEKAEWLKNQIWYKNGKEEYGCLFEKAHATKAERQRFIENIITDREPSFGYVVLADLLLRNYINTVLTTNFDDLVYISSTNFTGNRPIVYAYGILASEMKMTSPHSKLLKLHGDYLYSNIVNTGAEMLKQSQALKEPFKDEREAISSLNMERQVRTVFDNFGLVVIGYSGGDKTIMELLDNVSEDNGFYWCYVKNYPPDEDVLWLIKNKDGRLVEIEGFDSLMKEISDITDFRIDDLLDSLEQRKEKLKNSIAKFKYSKESLDKYAEELKESKTEDAKEKLSAGDYLILGNYEYEIGNYSKAEKYYRKAIEINPGKAEYHYKAGILLFADKSRWKDAEKLFLKALEINPRSAIVTNCLGFLRYLQGEIDEAIKLFEESIIQDYKLSFPYINLSAIYKTKAEKNNNNESDELKAAEYRNKAEECLKPIDYYLWACLYSAKRDKEKTIEYLSKAFEREPGKKISTGFSPTFDWIRNDKQFKKLVRS
jgi:tetratricopeptide (TPR) repeat protein